MSKPQSTKTTPFQKALHKPNPETKHGRHCIPGPTVSQGIHRYILSHPIIYWRTMGHPIGAGISCTILNFELGYYVPSQGMYYYILGQNSGPWSKIRAIRALSPQ